MSKLTDTQLIILSAASQRDDRGVELPANIKGEAARKAVDKLIRAGLLEEVRAAGSLPVWRRDDDGGPMALRITKSGLEVIDVEDEVVTAPKQISARPPGPTIALTEWAATTKVWRARRIEVCPGRPITASSLASSDNIILFVIFCELDRVLAEGGRVFKHLASTCRQIGYRDHSASPLVTRNSVSLEHTYPVYVIPSHCIFVLFQRALRT